MKKIFWTDKSCDIKTQWWLKVGFVDNFERFHFFCNKKIELVLFDIKNNKKITIKEGTHVAGYKMAQTIIKNEN